MIGTIVQCIAFSTGSFNLVTISISLVVTIICVKRSYFFSCIAALAAAFVYVFGMHGMPFLLNTSRFQAFKDMGAVNPEMQRMVLFGYLSDFIVIVLLICVLSAILRCVLKGTKKP